MENDRTLLRPFDLEAAKAGNKVVGVRSFTQEFEYVSGPNNKGEIAFSESAFGYAIVQRDNLVNLRMAPIYWIEHKPVYKGDALYATGGCHAGKLVVPNGAQIDKTEFGNYLPVGEENGQQNVSVEYLTWTKPVTKVKKDGWINIYPFNSINSPELNAGTGPVYVTENEALKQQQKGVSATIRIEWEEEK